MKFWFDTFKGRLLLTAVTYVIYMMLYILTDQQSREFYFGGAPFMEYVLDAAITLGGSAGWTNNSGFAIINPGNWLLSAIGSLTQPLFNRGQNIANLRIAKARQEEAMLSFRQSLLKAGNEVNDALAQWQTASSRLVIDRDQVEALRSAADNLEQLMQKFFLCQQQFALSLSHWLMHCHGNSDQKRKAGGPAAGL